MCIWFQKQSKKRAISLPLSFSVLKFGLGGKCAQTWVADKLGSLLYKQTLVPMPLGKELWEVNFHFLSASTLPCTPILELCVLPSGHSSRRGAEVKRSGFSPPGHTGSWDSWPLVLQEKTEHLLLCLRLLGDSTGRRCCLEKIDHVSSLCVQRVTAH